MLTTKGMIAAVLLLGLLLIFGLYQCGEGHVALPSTQAYALKEAQRRGDFKKVEQILGRLRRDWVQQDPRRLALVEQSQAEVTAIQTAHAGFLQQIAQEYKSKGYQQHLSEFKAIKHKGSKHQQQAARLILGRLREIRQDLQDKEVVVKTPISGPAPTEPTAEVEIEPEPEPQVRIELPAEELEQELQPKPVASNPEPSKPEPQRLAPVVLPKAEEPATPAPQSFSQDFILKLQRRLAALAGRSAKSRAKIYGDLSQEQPAALLKLALQGECQRMLEALDGHSFKGSWVKVVQQRAELDLRRAHALELINDEVKYFYPYRQPEVDAKTAARYPEVQKEVDQRVAQVREIWESRATKVTPPSSLQDKLAALQWLQQCLLDTAAGADRDAGADRELAKSMDLARHRLTWIRILPAQGELTVQNFCLDQSEYDQLALRQKIVSFNAALAARLKPGEALILRETNAYRRMLGRQALALNLKILAAARGHGEEMVRLGYFSHFSPSPGRRSPVDRMRKEGYMRGSGENISRNPQARGTFLGWLHSSAHHRSILHQGHREFAIGNQGSFWVQKFGSGREFLKHSDFAEESR